MNNYNSYYLWLLDKVDDGRGIDRDLDDLLWHLYETDFTWVIDRDENCAIYGLDLRYEFDPGWNSGLKPCSVLEMLIALAHSWEHDITYDFRLGDRSAEWFWLMLENLGLIDENREPIPTYEVDKIVQKWLRREFDKTGIGSPFPVLGGMSGMRDQRKLEIWLQLQDYLFENADL